MSHDEFQEALALRLYGELEAEEGARLAAHLEGCAACRAFAVELEAGLGRLVPAGPASPELPHGPYDPHDPHEWEARLRDSIAAPAPRRAAPLWLAAAAGFAAGLLAMAAWRAPADDARPARGPELAHGETFARATPPPRAESTGGLARLEWYAER